MTIQDVRSVLRGEGSHIVGAITMWSLSEVRVRWDDLRTAFEAIGLGDAVPRRPVAKALIKRACRRASLGRAALVADVVRDDVDQVIVALSSRATDETQAEARYAHQTRIMVSKRDGSILLENSEHAAAAEVSALYLDSLDYATGEDLATALHHALSGRTHDPMLAGVNLRGDAGGVYFVPETHLARLQALAGFVSEQGSSTMEVWEVTGSDKHLAQAARAVEGAFGVKLAKLREDVAAFATKLRSESSDPKAQEALDEAISSRRARYEELAAQVDTYADVLGAKRDGLLSSISEARDALRAAILGD
jgi:hypothetical protein